MIDSPKYLQITIIVAINIYNINRQSSKWGKSVAMAGVSLLSLGQRRESLDRCVRGDRVLITKANKEQDSQVVKIV